MSQPCSSSPFGKLPAFQVEESLRLSNRDVEVLKESVAQKDAAHKRLSCEFEQQSKLLVGSWAIMSHCAAEREKTLMSMAVSRENLILVCRWASRRAVTRLRREQGICQPTDVTGQDGAGLPLSLLSSLKLAQDLNTRGLVSPRAIAEDVQQWLSWVVARRSQMLPATALQSS